MRRVFELHGFASLETRAVEPLEQMLRKGEIDKEVYVLRRLHAEDDEPDAGLGLHFDLTVPFARYVLQNAGHLEFPFRRYQIQKVWRGRAAAGGPLPRVHPGRHRHRRPRHPRLPPRGRGRAGHGRGVPRPAVPARA